MRSDEPVKGQNLTGLVEVQVVFLFQKNRVVGGEKSESTFAVKRLGPHVPLVNK